MARFNVNIAAKQFQSPSNYTFSVLNKSFLCFFSISRHRRFLHRVSPTKHQNVAFIVAENRQHFRQICSNIYSSTPVDVSQETLCKSLDLIIENTEAQLISDVISNIVDNSCNIKSQDHLRTFFELALVSLAKDEASEKRRRERLFHKVTVKLFPNGLPQS